MGRCFRHLVGYTADVSCYSPFRFLLELLQFYHSILDTTYQILYTEQMLQNTFIFYGVSGSGKGTQAELLQSYLEKNDTERGALYLSTGKQFRDVSGGDLYTHKRVKEVLDNGGLLPAFLPVWVWTDWFIKNFDGSQHLILDGLARREIEAPVLSDALSFYGFKNPYIIFLNISRGEATRRLKERGRSDDTDEDIARRLDWFESDVMVAMTFLKNISGFQFLDIDGERSELEIHEDIVSRIQP